MEVMEEDGAVHVQTEAAGQSWSPTSSHSRQAPRQPESLQPKPAVQPASMSYIDSSAEEISGPSNLLRMQRQLRSHPSRNVSGRSHARGRGRYRYISPGQQMVQHYKFLDAGAAEVANSWRTPAFSEEKLLYPRIGTQRFDPSYLVPEEYWSPNPLIDHSGRAAPRIVYSRPLRTYGPSMADYNESVQPLVSSRARQRMVAEVDVDVESSAGATAEIQAAVSCEDAGARWSPEALVASPTEPRDRITQLTAAGPQEIDDSLTSLSPAATSSQIIEGSGPLVPEAPPLRGSTSTALVRTSQVEAAGRGRKRPYTFIDLGSYEHEVTLREAGRANRPAEPDVPVAAARPQPTAAAGGNPELSRNPGPGGNPGTLAASLGTLATNPGTLAADRGRRVPATLSRAADSEIQATGEPLADNPGNQPMPLHQLTNSLIPSLGSLPPGTRIILQVPKDYGGQTTLTAAAAPGGSPRARRSLRARLFSIFNFNVGYESRPAPAAVAAAVPTAAVVTTAAVAPTAAAVPPAAVAPTAAEVQAPLPAPQTPLPAPQTPLPAPQTPLLLTQRPLPAAAAPAVSLEDTPNVLPPVPHRRLGSGPVTITAEIAPVTRAPAVTFSTPAQAAAATTPPPAGFEAQLRAAPPQSGAPPPAGYEGAPGYEAQGAMPAATAGSQASVAPTVTPPPLGFEPPATPGPAGFEVIRAADEATLTVGSVGAAGAGFGASEVDFEEEVMETRIEEAGPEVVERFYFATSATVEEMQEEMQAEVVFEEPSRGGPSDQAASTAAEPQKAAGGPQTPEKQPVARTQPSPDQQDRQSPDSSQAQAAERQQSSRAQPATAKRQPSQEQQATHQRQPSQVQQATAKRQPSQEQQATQQRQPSQAQQATAKRQPSQEQQATEQRQASEQQLQPSQGQQATEQQQAPEKQQASEEQLASAEQRAARQSAVQAQARTAEARPAGSHAAQPAQQTDDGAQPRQQQASRSGSQTTATAPQQESRARQPTQQGSASRNTSDQQGRQPAAERTHQDLPEQDQSPAPGQQQELEKKDSGPEHASQSQSSDPRQGADAGRDAAWRQPGQTEANPAAQQSTAADRTENGEAQSQEGQQRFERPQSSDGGALTGASTLPSTPTQPTATAVAQSDAGGALSAASIVAEEESRSRSSPVPVSAGEAPEIATASERAAPPQAQMQAAEDPEQESASVGGASSRSRVGAVVESFKRTLTLKRGTNTSLRRMEPKQRKGAVQRMLACFNGLKPREAQQAQPPRQAPRRSHWSSRRRSQAPVVQGATAGGNAAAVAIDASMAPSVPRIRVPDAGRSSSRLQPGAILEDRRSEGSLSAAIQHASYARRQPGTQSSQQVQSGPGARINLAALPPLSPRSSLQTMPSSPVRIRAESVPDALTDEKSTDTDSDFESAEEYQEARSEFSSDRDDGDTSPDRTPSLSVRVAAMQPPKLPTSLEPPVQPTGLEPPYGSLTRPLQEQEASSLQVAQPVMWEPLTPAPATNVLHAEELPLLQTRAHTAADRPEEQPVELSYESDSSTPPPGRMDRFSSLSFESVGTFLAVEVGQPPPSRGVGYESDDPAQQVKGPAGIGCDKLQQLSTGERGAAAAAKAPSGYKSNGPTTQHAKGPAGIGCEKPQQLSTGKGSAAAAAKAQAGQNSGGEEQPELHHQNKGCGEQPEPHNQDNDPTQLQEMQQADNPTAHARSQAATACPGLKAAAASDQTEAQARGKVSGADQQQQQDPGTAEAAEHAAGAPASEQHCGLPGSGFVQPGIASRPEQAAEREETVTGAAEKQPVNLPPSQPQAPKAQEEPKMNINGAVGSHAKAAEQDTKAERQTLVEGLKSGSAALHSQLPPTPTPDRYESPIDWGRKATLEQHTQSITAVAKAGTSRIEELALQASVKYGRPSHSAAATSTSAASEHLPSEKGDKPALTATLHEQLAAGMAGGSGPGTDAAAAPPFPALQPKSPFTDGAAKTGPATATSKRTPETILAADDSATTPSAQLPLTQQPDTSAATPEATSTQLPEAVAVTAGASPAAPQLQVLPAKKGGSQPASWSPSARPQSADCSPSAIESSSAAAVASQGAAVQNQAGASKPAAAQSQAGASKYAALQNQAGTSKSAAAESQAVEPAPGSKIPSPGPGRRPQPPRDAQPSRIPKPLAHGSRLVGWLKGRDQPKPAAESAVAALANSSEPRGPEEEHRGAVAQDASTSAKGAQGETTIVSAAVKSARESAVLKSQQDSRNAGLPAAEVSLHNARATAQDPAQPHEVVPLVAALGNASAEAADGNGTPAVQMSSVGVQPAVAGSSEQGQSSGQPRDSAAKVLAGTAKAGESAEPVADAPDQVHAALQAVQSMIARGALEEHIAPASPGAPGGGQTASPGSDITATKLAAGQTDGQPQSPAMLETQISKVAQSSAGSQGRAGSAGSLDSLAEILGPLPPGADDGKAPPTTEGNRCDTAAGPVAAGGSKQSRRASSRSAASC